MAVMGTKEILYRIVVVSRHISCVLMQLNGRLNGHIREVVIADCSSLVPMVLFCFCVGSAFLVLESSPVPLLGLAGMMSSSSFDTLPPA